jgi:8-amino-7-oxononanoate synthase
MKMAEQLEAELQALRARSLHRRLRPVASAQGPRVRCDGRELVNFSSNDYLGLANHPALKTAALEAVRQYGAGAGAARLISGSLAPLHALETALAEYKSAGAALCFNSGYAAATGVLPALMGKHDIVIVDKLVHACLVDGARLAGARLRVFAHNDLEDLAAKLQWAATQEHEGKPVRVLVVVESIYSMDGDAAPLAEMVALKEHHGAWLLVDEAHATGLYGASGAGRVLELGLGGRVEIQLGTLGKALGAAGGFIAGSPVLAEFLVNRARSFIFSTAPVPAAAAAALAGVGVARSEEGAARRRQLWARAAQLRAGLAALDLAPAEPPAAIIPVLLRDEDRALAVAQALWERGFFIPAIRYPTVPRGGARLRITLSAAHSAAEVDLLLGALKDVI